MKKTFLLTLSVMLCLFSGCTQQTGVPPVVEPQTQEDETKSQTVDFLEKSGDLIEKQYFDIGIMLTDRQQHYASIKFQNIVITNIVTKRKVGALRLEAESSSSLGTDTYIGTLDSDELEACIKSLKYLKDNVIGQQASTYTECEYKSRDGVLIGAYSNLEKPEDPWTLYISPQKHISRSRRYFSSDQISMLIWLLEKAQAQLKESGI